MRSLLYRRFATCKSLHDLPMPLFSSISILTLCCTVSILHLFCNIPFIRFVYVKPFTTGIYAFSLSTLSAFDGNSGRIVVNGSEAAATYSYSDWHQASAYTITYCPEGGQVYAQVTASNTYIGGTRTRFTAQMVQPTVV